MNFNKALGILVLVLLPSLCFSASKESERINGITDFLLERGKENYLYIFAQTIKNNKEVQCYFPTIYSYISDGDLRLLLKGRKLWSESVEPDLKNLIVRSAAKKLGKQIDFNKVALNATNQYLEVAQYLSVNYEGQLYPLTVMPLKPSQELRDLINGFYDVVNELQEVLLKMDAKLKKVNGVCNTPEITLQDIADLAAEFKEATQKITAWKNHVTANRKNLVVNAQKIIDDCTTGRVKSVCSIRENLIDVWMPSVTNDMSEKAQKVIGTAVVLATYSQEIKSAEGNTAKVLLAVNLLKNSGTFEDEEVLDKFKRHILFFAELSDAETAAQTKEILSEYALPPVSFAVKREQYKNHVLVSAYLGFGYGKVTNSSSFGEDNKKGIYAPIGLEFSRGFKHGGSLSLMVAPFDFGYPVSLKWNGVNKDVELNEIVAPSVAISYGIADYPLSIGVAYQKGRKSDITHVTEERAFVFLAIDMPLWTLY